MTTRGYERKDLFGPLTLRQINRKIRAYARQLGVTVTIYQSDNAEKLAHYIRAADQDGTAAVVRGQRMLRGREGMTVAGHTRAAIISLSHNLCDPPGAWCRRCPDSEPGFVLPRG